MTCGDEAWLQTTTTLNGELTRPSIGPPPSSDRLGVAGRDGASERGISRDSEMPARSRDDDVMPCSKLLVLLRYLKLCPPIIAGRVAVSP